MNVTTVSALPVTVVGNSSPGGASGTAASGSSVAVAEAASAQVVAEGGADMREEVDNAVASMQSFVQAIRRDLNFSIDDSSGRVVVKVIDGGSGEVVRQIPSEEALKLAAGLEEARSLLFSEQV